MFIKICGCRRPEDVAAAAEAGADAVGINLVPGRRRSLAREAAARVRAAVPGGVLAAGIFLDQPLEEVLAWADALELDAVQLHGREPQEYVDRVRARYRVLRAWNLEPPRPAADWLLVEPGAGADGGSGEGWDWGRARGQGGGTPLVLAGGLTPENVAAACDRARPDGVDVASGVEVEGNKDPGRIARFCAAVRAWEAGQGG